MINIAVIPVAGLGTRLLPATKSQPKEMLPVVNVPLIQHAFEEAKAAGIEQFILITLHIICIFHPDHIHFPSFF